MKQAVPILLGSLLLLSACGSDNESTPPQEISDSVEDMQEVLSISGKVVDDVIPDATVSVIVGGETYTTTANADGEYELEVPYTNGNELLTIRAKGSPEHGQGFVELISILSSIHTLAVTAGDDRVLDSSESFGTNVTNVTTANYALMRNANGGEAPTDEEGLALAQEAVDATELLEMSAVIKLIIDVGYSMPEGNESTLDFVTKVDSYRAEVEKIRAENSKAIEDMIATIIADGDLVQKKTTAKLPSFYIPTAATTPGFVSKSREIFTFNEDGTGTFVSVEPGTTHNFTWVLEDNGFYTMTYDTPISTQWSVGVRSVTDDTATIEACEMKNFGLVDQVSSETSRQFKVVVEGDRVDLVRERVSITRSYDTSSCDSGLAAIPDDTTEDSYSRAYLNGDDLQLISLTENDVAGTWALNILGQFSEKETFERFIPDMVTFSADGSFSAQYSGVTGTWELTDGAIDLFYDGVEQRVEMYNEINSLYGALMSAEAEDGAKVAVYEYAVKQNPDVSLTADDLLTEADELWFGHITSWVKSSWDEEAELPKIEQYFGWQFKSPTEAFNLYVRCEEEAEQTCKRGVTTQKVIAGEQLDWLIKDDGKVVQIDRVDYPSSFNPGDRIRRWNVLDVTEDGWMYVLEFDFYDHAPDNGIDDISELDTASYNRINMLNIMKLPDGLSH